MDCFENYFKNSKVLLKNILHVKGISKIRFFRSGVRLFTYTVLNLELFTFSFYSTPLSMTRKFTLKQGNLEISEKDLKIFSRINFLHTKKNFLSQTGDFLLLLLKGFKVGLRKVRANFFMLMEMRKFSPTLGYQVCRMGWKTAS